MSSATVDTGLFSVRVPRGWKLFYGIDSDGRETSKKVHIYKNAELPTDIFTHAGITVCFFGKDDIYMPTKGFYDDVCDIAPLAIGDYSWSGYTCTSFGYPYTMLEARYDECIFQVMILKKNGEHRISFDGEEVKSILESLRIS